METSMKTSMETSMKTSMETSMKTSMETSKGKLTVISLQTKHF